MAMIKILAGDFGTGTGSIFFGQLSIPQQLGRSDLIIKAGGLKSVEMASEQSVKKFAGAAGWGALGGVVLGPAGLLAGLLLGGKSKKTSFIAQLRDGRSFLGTIDDKAYTQILALVDYGKPLVDSGKPIASQTLEIEIEDSGITKINPLDPITNIEYALSSKGWKIKREPRNRGQRYTILLAKNSANRVAISCSQDALTEYAFYRMKDAMIAYGQDAILVIIGNSVGKDVQKIAKQEDAIVATYHSFNTTMLKTEPTGFDF